MNRLAEVEVTAPAPMRLFALATGVIVISLLSGKCASLDSPHIQPTEN